MDHTPAQLHALLHAVGEVRLRDELTLLQTGVCATGASQSREGAAQFERRQAHLMARLEG